MKTKEWLAAGFCCLAWTAPAAAQARSVEVVADLRDLSYRYRFENDSSFDTATLVPHFFEQRYDRDGAELAIRAHYRLLSRRMTTAVSFAPAGSGFGSDFDTFFQPDGDVVMSGTAGEVTLASLGFEQSISVLDRRGIGVAVRYAWRRDRADFMPASRIVSHTQPPSRADEFTTDREMTTSQTFEVGAEASFVRHAGKWSVEGSAHLSPAMRARLLVRLPDKYPDRDIVFTAPGWNAGGSARLTRRIGRLMAGVWVSADKSGSYRPSAQYGRETLAAGISIGAGRL